MMTILKNGFRFRSRIGHVALLVLIGVIQLFADDNQPRFFECQVEAKNGENFNYAAAQLWAPTESQALQGILCVVIHPLDNGGATLANPWPWLALAKQYNCALLAVSFAQSNDPTKIWCKPELGTGAALLKAIEMLAKESGMIKLTKAPLVIVGVCAAGQFSYNFAALYPERVKTFVTIGGGKHNLNYAAKASTVPGMLVAGADRGPNAIDNMKRLFSEGEKNSAPWTLAAEEIAKYDSGLCSLEVADYLSESLRKLCSTTPDKKPLITSLAASKGMDYVSLPFPGKKLPPPGAIDSNPIDEGTLVLDDLKPDSGHFVFEVRRSPGSKADAIFVDCSAIVSHVKRLSEETWRVDGAVKLQESPLGALSLEVPVYFLHLGKPLLGQARASVVGKIVGDINISPRSLSLGLVPVDKSTEVKIHLVSKSGKPVTLLSAVSTSQEWVTADAQKTSPTSVDLTCRLKPPRSAQDVDGFGGYLGLKCQTDRAYNLKIYYYGFAGE